MGTTQFQMTPEREIKLWSDSIVVFDSSALLNFYEYSKDTRKNIFDTTLKVLKNRLWIPYQVNYEFNKNRLKTLTSPTNLYVELKDQHLFKVQEHLSQIKTRTKKPNRHPHLDQVSINQFFEAFDAFKKVITEEIDLRVEEINLMRDSDDVLKAIIKYFKVSQEYSYSSLTSIAQEGEFRYRNSIPPGYKDQDEKIGFQMYGDLILWKQIIGFAKFSNKPVILVIDDVKEDWWHLSNKRGVERPREELLLEIKEEAKVDFWMYTSGNFLEKASEFLNTKIKEQAIMEVRSASTNYSSYLAETAFMRWAVIKYGSVGEITAPVFAPNSPVDLVFSDFDGKTTAFIIKFFKDGRNRFISQRLKHSFEFIAKGKIKSIYSKITVVLITESMEAAQSQYAEIGNSNQLSMFVIDDNTDFIVGYIEDDEFIQVTKDL